MVLIAVAIVSARDFLISFRPQGVAEYRQSTSPDGIVTASELYDDHNHGLGTAPWFGVVLSPKGEDPMLGRLVLYGSGFHTSWSAPNRLNVFPDCDGWFEIKHDQVCVSGRLISAHVFPAKPCSMTPLS